MSDIFHEVEEEVRRERFEQLWKQYGDYVIAGFALIIIAIAGFELYQRYQTNERLKASETLIAAQQLADSGDIAKATPGFALIAKDSPSGYAKMARLSQAGALLQAGQRDAAVAIYKSVAGEDAGVIGKVAIIREAWALVDTAEPSEMQALLAPLSDAQNPWRFAAREILAYADFHAGQNDKAQAEFKALAQDKDAPEQMRRRVAAMAEYLANGATVNFGTVPPPEPAPPVPGVPPAPGAAPAPPSAPPAAGAITPPTGTPPK